MQSSAAILNVDKTTFSFFKELECRNVIRVGIACLVTAWLLLRVADVLLNNLELPGWVFRTTLVILAIGLPVALLLAWAFELTREGIRKEKELNNNLDELLNLQEDTPLLDIFDGFYLQNYVDTNRRLLLVQQSAGRTEMAHEIARRIIAVEKVPVFHGTDFAAGNHEALAVAYATLGDEDKAQEWVGRLMNDRNETYNAYGVQGFMALAVLNADKAVELILNSKTQHPTWRGTDVIAMFHISNRDILRHPDKQAFYLQEGKWIDYLAERVPEYEQFRRVQ